MTNPLNAAVMRGVIERESHELVGHVRVILKKEKNLIYHIEPGIELKINIELGPVFFRDPKLLRERLARIITHACQFNRGTRIADAVHHTEPEYVS